MTQTCCDTGVVRTFKNPALSDDGTAGVGKGASRKPASAPLPHWTGLRPTAWAKPVPAQAGIALRAAQPAGDHRRRFCLSYSYRAESAAGLGAGGRGVGSLTAGGADLAGPATWPPPSLASSSASALDGSTSPQPNSSSRPLGSSLLALDVSTSNTVSASTSGWRSMSKAATPLT